MKKSVLVIIVVAVLGLTAAGVVGYKFISSPKTPGQNSQAPTTGQNVITSIKDALAKSMSLKCDYPDPTNKNTITSYIKNGAVRVGNFTLAEKVRGNAIIKDNKMWVWTEGEKQGMVISLADSQAAATGNKNQQEEIFNDLERNKQFCKAEVVADSLFTPPADVQFLDLAAAQGKLPLITSDDELIKQALFKKNNWKESDGITVKVSTNDGKYASGTVGSSGGGGYFYAAKSGDAWVIVADGNGIISCSSLTKYPDFPKTLIPECFDQASQKIIKR